MYKFIRVKELAALHKLEQMLRVRILERQSTWKRENDVDRIASIAERHEETLRPLHTGYDPEHFCTRIRYNARRPPISEEFSVGLKVEAERLRLERLLSQPPSPKLLPRKLTA